MLDARSDVFSLGVVLYELATGTPPFNGTTTAVVFDRILNHAPVAPVELNPGLPIDFENILNKTLEKDRELRCQSAAELRADLKRLQRSSGSGRVSASGQASMASGVECGGELHLVGRRRGAYCFVQRLREWGDERGGGFFGQRNFCGWFGCRV